MPDPLTLFEPHFKGAKSCGSEMQAFCPAHADKNARSMTYHLDTETGNLVVTCHAGCSYEAIAAACGLPVSAMFATPKDASGEVAHVYTYRDEDGTPSRDVIRYADGGYSQRSYRPDGTTVNNVKDTPILPYRLNELRLAIESGKTIWIPEGEKDCETLRDHGLCATTFPNGCNATWGPEHAEHFRPAKRIILLTDCDEGEPGTGKRKGREAAHDRALLMRTTVTDDVNLLDLAPDRHDGFDVTDWFEDGGTVEELERLADEAQKFAAATAAPKSAVRQFTKLYDDIRGREDLSVYDKIVLAEVVRDGEIRAHPKFKIGRKMSFQTIADGWKISRRVVVKSLKRLEDDGFIVAHRTSGGRQRMNRYDAVVPMPPQTVHAVHSSSRTNGAQHAPFAETPDVGNGAPHALVECTACTGPVHGVHSHVRDMVEKVRDDHGHREEIRYPLQMGSAESKEQQRSQSGSLAENGKAAAAKSSGGERVVLAAELAARGVAADDVAALLDEYTPERIRKQLHYSRSAASTVQSIKADWPEPKNAAKHQPKPQAPTTTPSNNGSVKSDDLFVHEACGQALPWWDEDGKMRCMRCDPPGDVKLAPTTRDAVGRFFDSLRGDVPLGDLR